MMKAWKIFSQKSGNVALFVSGVLVSAVISSSLARIISWSEIGLFVAILILIVITIFYLSEIHQRVQELTSKAQTTVFYVEESYRQQEGIEYKGLAYIELTRLIKEAKSEMLTLSTFSSVDEGGRITDSHASRQEYFVALEDTIVRNQPSGFKYVRIQQVPREGENSPIIKFITEATANHFRQIINLERRIQNGKINLSIMKVPTQRLTNFIVIDRQYVLLVVDGMDSENRPYAAGMFVIEDRGGKIVEKFVGYFENLERLAKPVLLTELEKSSQSQLTPPVIQPKRRIR